MTRFSRLLVAALTLAGAPSLILARSASAAEPVDLVTAVEHAKDLERLLAKSGSTNEALVEAIGIVAQEFHEVLAPTDPAALREFRDAVKSYRRRARSHLLAALLLVDVDPKTRVNLRDLVCVEGARALGVVFADARAVASIRRDVSLDIRRALETSLYRPRAYRVSMELAEACFDALARMNERTSLEWMVAEHIHTRDVPEDIVQMLAAQRAMVKFNRVPGVLRFQIVKRMISLYAGSETLAEDVIRFPGSRAQAAKQFWDKVRVTVIAVLQFYCRMPVNERGQAFSTLREFQVWWQRHDNVTRDPWLDRPR